MNDLQWYVIYTLPNNEKRISTNLQRLGITTFLPTSTVIRHWSDRRKKVEVPLFSCYLFVKISSDARFEVLKEKGVVRYLDSNTRPTLVPQAEIDLMKDIAGRSSVCRSSLALEIGDLVMITSGPLKGITGPLIGKKGSYRTIIRINSLNKDLLVDISCERIEKLEIPSFKVA